MDLSEAGHGRLAKYRDAAATQLREYVESIRATRLLSLE